MQSLKACCAKPAQKPHEARFSLSGKSSEVAQTDLRVTELVDDADVHAADTARGWANNLPVVIVPGFMSSGLQVAESTERPDWKDERIWFSLQKLAGSAAASKTASSRSSRQRRGSVVLGSARLVVTLHCAADLPAMDLNGKSDPYVRVSLLSADGKPLSEPQESEVQPKTLNPEWQEELVFGTDCPVDQTSTIQLLVVDHDTLTAHDPIGAVDIQIDPSVHKMRRKKQAQARAMAGRRTSVAGPLGARSVSLGELHSESMESKVMLHEQEEMPLHMELAGGRVGSGAGGGAEALARARSISETEMRRGTITVSVAYIPAEGGSSEDDSEDSEDDQNEVRSIHFWTLFESISFRFH